MSSKRHSALNLKRRSFVKAAGLSGLVGASSIAGCIGTTGGGSGPLKVGQLAAQSGGFAIYGDMKMKAGAVAVQEINDNGGLNGREVQHLTPDPASEVQQYKNLTEQLILEDEVDVLVGPVSSAAREAMRPVVDKNKQLYFYDMVYEGGVCDEYTFVTGGTASQHIRPMCEYMVENFGPNVYTVAADYNFGQISAMWNQRYIEELGGEVVGEEFVPLSVSDFGATINRIDNADPDWIFGILVGANHVSYFEQAHSEGKKVPLGTISLVGLTYEHQLLPPPTMTGVHSALNYLEELPSEASQEFVQKVRDKYPDIKYVGQPAEGSYNAIRLWAEAVEAAGTADQEAVHDELEKGPTLDSPEGKIQLNPSTHHLNHNVHIVRVEDDHSLSFQSSSENRGDPWLEERCALNTDESTWDDPVTTQHLPE